MSNCSSKSLATKYRPTTFEQVVGQHDITDILENQIKTKTFRNVVLFTGPAGCGKTTSARAFSKLLNNGKGTPIEIDAASHNGVDDVREIGVKAQQKSLDSDYKVFIMDECHMLSNSAWAAMLKLIEEPPINTVFIFCTTDPQKIPATIMSRVQRFNFKRISHEDIVNRLKFILKSEGIEVNKNVEEGLDYIAKLSSGGMRDAITMMDKCLSYSTELCMDNVIKALGSIDYTVYFKLTNAIIDYAEKDVIDIIENVYREGSDLKQFIKQFTLFLLDVCKYAVFNNFDYIQIPNIYKNDLDYLIEAKDFIKDLLDNINKLNSDIKWESDVKNIVELRLLILTQPNDK